MIELESAYIQLKDGIELGDLPTVQQVIDACRSNRYDLERLLFHTILKNDLTTLQCLLRCKVDLKYEDINGRRAIHIAAEIGNAAILKNVIYAGSPLNIVDKQGLGPLHISLIGRHEEAAMLLIKEGATVNRPKEYTNKDAPIHVAARNGLDRALQFMIRTGADVNLVTGDGSSPLHLAVKEKHMCTAHLLCENGANVNCFDSRGRTPFIQAGTQMSFEMVKTILPFVSDVNVTDRDGMTALHCVSSAYPPTKTQLDIMSMLLDAGANIRHCDNGGRTALHMAAAAGNAISAEILISHGAELEVKEKLLGETPLNMASAYNRDEVIHLLLKNGANVNTTDQDQMSPLHKVQISRVGRNKLTSTDWLLRYGAQVNIADSRGVTALEQCVFHSITTRDPTDRLAVIQRLVSAGSRLQPNLERRTMQHSPLCWLAWYGELEAAAFLVNAGWNLNQESWVELPGKNDSMELFFDQLRRIIHVPASLQRSCRHKIRQQLSLASCDRDIVPSVGMLPLPNDIKCFLLCQNDREKVC